jgi:hypothetical protein
LKLTVSDGIIDGIETDKIGAVMLTDLAVRKAVARDKPYKLSDGGGLYLLVTKAGQRCWRVDYRFGEKRATAALGVYPTITLADRRKRSPSPPPQPTLPAIRQAILTHPSQPPPLTCPHCRRRWRRMAQK